MDKAATKISITSLSGNTVKFLILFLLISSGSLLALQPELRLAVPLLVGATATMAIMLASAFYFGDRGTVAWSPAAILTVALLLRLMFLFSPPQLSDDIYRYLWDGSNLLRGTNPYAAAPYTMKPSYGLADVHSRINHPRYITIYPPAAQLIFAGGASMGGTITGFKAFLVFLDMGLCALMIMLLKRLEMPVWRSVLYAWNPLPVLEIAGSGHVDGAGLSLLLGSIYLIAGNKRRVSGAGLRRWPFLLSGVLLAAAGLVKLFPFVLVPLLFLLVPKGQRRYFTAGFITALTILIVPFLPHLTNMLASLDTYARNWEFAGFAFTTLRTMTGSGTTARLILSAAFLLTVAAMLLRYAATIDSTETPAARTGQTLNACYAVAMALLLLTPTLQPWYALCLALFLPFCAGPAGLVFCWVVFLAYQVQIPYFILGQWHENQPVTAAVFVAPVTAWGLARLFDQWRGRPVAPGKEIRA